VREVAPAAALRGAAAVPGDKSISHRALLLAALAEGESELRGLLRAGDTESTISVLRQLGAEIEDGGRVVVVRGVGLRGLREAAEPLDCGNAGTLLRLVSGILAGHGGRFALVGDESLSRRPQERIAEPLRLMGARIETTDGHAPVSLDGGALRAIRYAPPVASAQVKSAVLLAAVNASGATTVVEPRPTRDHTELMLEAGGVRVRRRPTSVTVDPVGALRLGDVAVPGDFSSAAPFLVAAALVPGSELTVHDVGLNPRRTGLLDVLERMGARLTVYHRRRVGGEPIGDVEVRAGHLVATTVDADEVPLLVDELPLVALAAGMAHGETVVRGAEELRVKESDRIEAVTSGLRAVGVRIRERPDGFEVTGVPSRPRGGKVDSRGDHRIAMVGALAGLVSREGVEVEGAEAVSVSFPGFYELLDSLTRR
jgi:3-phosphoshikimate 1-carboxyvinyltransferase